MRWSLLRRSLRPYVSKQAVGDCRPAGMRLWPGRRPPQAACSPMATRSVGHTAARMVSISAISARWAAMISPASFLASGDWPSASSFSEAVMAPL